MSEGITWVKMEVCTTDSNNPTVEIENARLDRLEFDNSYVKIGALNDVYYIFPLDSILYLKYKED